jgi:fatty-acyl-CoA synthase
LDLPYLIRRAAQAHPDAPAVGDKRVTTSLGEIVARAERFANALDGCGIPEGAPVGVLSENRVEYVCVDLALALARRVRVALNCRLHRDDFRFALRDSDARALVHSATFADDGAALASELGLLAINLDGSPGSPGSFEGLVAEGAPASVRRRGSEEAPAWISYTSGTSGRPKGVVLSHRAIREVAFNLLLELGPQAPGERLVLAQPLSHGAGYFVLPYLLSGGGVYVMERFDAEEAVWAIGQSGVTTLKVVPAMLPPFLEAHAAGGSKRYRTVIYGAAPIPAPVLEDALERLGPVLVQIYGQSEAPMTLTCLHEADHRRRGPHRASAGRAWRSVAVEARNSGGEALPPGEVGELTIRGSHHMTGYLGLEDETNDVLRDGWVWTKDIGTIDEEGFVYLLGRRDEMINSGGFNIAPREVEQVLQDHPAVLDCAVIGLPDQRWGAAVSALVQLRCGAAASTEEIVEFVRPRLTFRTPKRILVTDAIPKNAYGKVDRASVRRAFEDSSGC